MSVGTVGTGWEQYWKARIAATEGFDKCLPRSLYRAGPGHDYMPAGFRIWQQMIDEFDAGWISVFGDGAPEGRE